MKNIFITFLISHVSTVFLVQKITENSLDSTVTQIGKFNIDLPPNFGEQIRKRINEIRLCHNAFDSGTDVSDRCLQKTKNRKRKQIQKRFHSKTRFRNLIKRRKLSKIENSAE